MKVGCVCLAGGLGFMLWACGGLIGVPWFLRFLGLATGFLSAFRV